MTGAGEEHPEIFFEFGRTASQSIRKQRSLDSRCGFKHFIVVVYLSSHKIYIVIGLDPSTFLKGISHNGAVNDGQKQAANSEGCMIYRRVFLVGPAVMFECVICLPPREWRVRGRIIPLRKGLDLPPF